MNSILNRILKIIRKNEAMKIEPGYAYLFKDANILKINTTASNEVYKSSPFADDRRYARKLYTDGKYFTENAMEYYTKYLKDGYAVVDATYSKDTTSLEDIPMKCTCILPETISKKDTDNIYSVFNYFEQGKIFNDYYIYSYRRTDFGMDYDYFTTFETNCKLSESLLALLHRKTGELSAYEKEMFNHYENFDLEYTFLTDNMYKYKEINNRNSGVVVIDRSGERYCTGNHKRQHGSDIDTIMQYLHHEDISDLDICDTVLKHGDIIIQLNHMENPKKELAYGEAIIWLPEEMTSLQIDEFSSFLDEVEMIDYKERQKGNQPIRTIAAVCLDHHFTVNEISDLRSYIEEQKTKGR